jgi:hypothetical protein
LGEVRLRRTALGRLASRWVRCCIQDWAGFGRARGVGSRSRLLSGLQRMKPACCRADRRMPGAAICLSAPTASRPYPLLPFRSHAAPSNLTANVRLALVRLTWTDNSGNETSFRISRCVGLDCDKILVGANVTTYDIFGGLRIRLVEQPPKTKPHGRRRPAPRRASFLNGVAELGVPRYPHLPVRVVT